MSCSRPLTLAIRKSALIASVLLPCLTCKAYAFDHHSNFHDGEETILIEDSTGAESSYGRTVLSLSTQALGFYIGSLLNDGENCSESLIRNFNDLANRTQYNLSLKQEQVELKLSLKF